MHAELRKPCGIYFTWHAGMDRLFAFLFGGELEEDKSARKLALLPRLEGIAAVHDLLLWKDCPCCLEGVCCWNRRAAWLYEPQQDCCACPSGLDRPGSDSMLSWSTRQEAAAQGGDSDGLDQLRLLLPVRGAGLMLAN